MKKQNNRKYIKYEEEEIESFTNLIPIFPKRKGIYCKHTQFFNFDMEISYSFKLSLIFQRQMAKIYLYQERKKALLLNERQWRECVWMLE